ncbi:MAG: hypothetical protein DDT35_01378 [Firmicutes bacterium]|nr:hypothetical protein [Bacillota bacterium]
MQTQGNGSAGRSGLLHKDAPLRDNKMHPHLVDRRIGGDSTPQFLLQRPLVVNAALKIGQSEAGFIKQLKPNPGVVKALARHHDAEFMQAPFRH